MKCFYLFFVIVVASLLFGCSKDCEEPEEPQISFEPYFASDSIRVWGDFASAYDIDEIALELTGFDSSMARLSLSATEIVIYPIGEIAETDGNEFIGSVRILDAWLDTTIAIVDFESTLEGGDNSSLCINPLIKTVVLKQDNRVIYDGLTYPQPSVYISR